MKLVLKLIVLLLIVTSCGKDTDNWPKNVLLEISIEGTPDPNRYLWLTDSDGNIITTVNATEDMTVMRPEGFDGNKFDIHFVISYTDIYATEHYFLETHRDFKPGKLTLYSVIPSPATIVPQIGSASITVTDLPNEFNYSIGYGRGSSLQNSGTSGQFSRSILLFDLPNGLCDAYILIESDNEQGFMRLYDLEPNGTYEISFDEFNKKMISKTAKLDETDQSITYYLIRGYAEKNNFSIGTALYKSSPSYYSKVHDLDFRLPKNLDLFKDYSTWQQVNGTDYRYTSIIYGSIETEFNMLNAYAEFKNIDIDNTQLEITGNFDVRQLIFYSQKYNEDGYPIVDNQWLDYGKSDHSSFPNVPTEILEIYPWLVTDTFTEVDDINPGAYYAGTSLELKKEINVTGSEINSVKKFNRNEVSIYSRGPLQRQEVENQKSHFSYEPNELDLSEN